MEPYTNFRGPPPPPHDPILSFPYFPSAAAEKIRRTGTNAVDQGGLLPPLARKWATGALTKECFAKGGRSFFHWPKAPPPLRANITRNRRMRNIRDTCEVGGEASAFQVPFWGCLSGFLAKRRSPGSPGAITFSIHFIIQKPGTVTEKSDRNLDI